MSLMEPDAATGPTAVVIGEMCDGFFTLMLFGVKDKEGRDFGR